MNEHYLAEIGVQKGVVLFVSLFVLYCEGNQLSGKKKNSELEDTANQVNVFSTAL